MKIKVTVWKPNPGDQLKRSQICHIVSKFKKKKITDDSCLKWTLLLLNALHIKNKITIDLINKLFMPAMLDSTEQNAAYTVHAVINLARFPPAQCSTIGMQKGQVPHRACACQFLITMLSGR